MNHPPYVQSTATFSRCKAYRYTLRRRWQQGGRTALFVLLNPSTADAVQDDPTVRRCAGFAHAWGYAGYAVANIFALRSTDPAALYRHARPVGERNDAAIRELAGEASLIVCAWGNHGEHLSRGRDVADMLRRDGRSLHCLRMNGSANHPAHPLYLPSACKPLPWV